MAKKRKISESLAIACLLLKRTLQNSKIAKFS